MEPQFAAQDVLRCYLCQTPAPPYHCDPCRVNLCTACVGEHLDNESSEHKVLPIEQQWCPPKSLKCPNHPRTHYEFHCEQCDIPVCNQCSFNEHKHHTFEDINKALERKKKGLQRDLQELEKSIYPKYKELASLIPGMKADVRNCSQKLSTALNKQGEIIHREIDTIIQRMQSKIDEMQSESTEVLNQQEDKITDMISKISQSIQNLKQLLDSNDFYVISAYSSNNAQYRKLPPNLKFSFPTFTPKEINLERLHQQIGSLSRFSMTTEEHVQDFRICGSQADVLARALMEVPHILRTIHTRYNYLQNVHCLRNEEKLWTRGRDNIIRLYNLAGELLRSTKMEEGSAPEDIAVTWQGHLVYTDYGNRTVNIVRGSKVKTLINLNGWIRVWKPRAVSSTSSGDLLVLMDSNNDTQTKVVRYNDTTEKHSIQFGIQGQPLYSSGGTKHITENRNLDVCVADYKAGAIVVVSSDGKFRFRYTGPSSLESSFYPAGITTDSQGRILTADHNSSSIHILDRDGLFLRYIDNCALHSPWGLSVDSRDNLFVVEYDTDKVIQIQYTF